MLFIMFIRNLLIFLRNYIFIINLIKKQNIFYFLVYIFFYFLILPNVAYCETVDVEDELTKAKRIQDEKDDELIKKIEICATIVLVVGLVVLGVAFVDYFFGPYFDNGSFPDPADIPEIKEPPKRYTQGPGYHFFVRDMGIRYDADCYSIPEVPVNLDHLNDQKSSK